MEKLDEATYDERLEQLVETRGSYYLARLELGDPPYEIAIIEPAGDVTIKMANTAIYDTFDTHRDGADDVSYDAEYDTELSPYLPFPPAKSADQMKRDHDGNVMVKEVMGWQ